MTVMARGLAPHHRRRCDPPTHDRMSTLTPNATTTAVRGSVGKKADGGAVGPKRTIHVYTDAPLLELWLNGHKVLFLNALPSARVSCFPIALTPPGLPPGRRAGHTP